MEYDVIVVGMGIAGITSAMYLKNQGVSVLLLDSDAPGGLLNKINIVTNYPGIPEISGPDFAIELFKNIQNNNIPYKISKVLEIKSENNKKVVVTEKEVFYSSYVVIATGRVRNKLGIENEEELLGRGISTCALCDGHLYKNEVIAVVGGGNSALEESLYLSNIVKKIYLIVRKDSFRGDASLVDEVLKKDNIEILYNSNVTEIIKENDNLKEIVINNEKHLPVKAMFTYIGFVPNHNFINNIVEEDGYIKVDKNYETSIKGIYAIGDVIKKDVYQLITAAGEGAIASVHIINQMKNK